MISFYRFLIDFEPIKNHMLILFYFSNFDFSPPSGAATRPVGPLLSIPQALPLGHRTPPDHRPQLPRRFKGQAAEEGAAFRPAGIPSRTGAPSLTRQSQLRFFGRFVM